MKLLTHNMLACTIKGVKNGFPLKIEAEEVVEREADFDPGAQQGAQETPRPRPRRRRAGTGKRLGSSRSPGPDAPAPTFDPNLRQIFCATSTQSSSGPRLWRPPAR